jgi:hypothetical protein
MKNVLVLFKKQEVFSAGIKLKAKPHKVFQMEN